MGNNEDFGVTFERDMTLKYTDAEGEWKFAFELGSSSRPKALYLYRKPLPSVTSREACGDLALKRTIEYLESLEYEVDVIDE